MSLFPVYAPQELAAATVSNTHAAVSGADATSYSFSSVAFGAADAKRLVVVGVSYGLSTGPTSVTVAGNGATQHVEANNGEENSSIWSYALASGTSGTVVVASSGSPTGAGIIVWRVVTSTPTVSDTGSDNDSATASTTLDIPAAGVAVGNVMTRSNTDRTYTWSGLTEDVDAAIDTGDYSHTGASKAFAAIQSGLTISATPNIAPTHRYPVMALVSWGP